MGYHHTVWNDIKESIKQNYLIVFMLDLAFFVATFLFLSGYQRLAVFIQKTDVVGRFVVENTLATVKLEAIPDNLMSGLTIYLAKHIFAIVALIILIYVTYSIVGAAIWNFIVKKKISLKHKNLFLRGNLLVLLLALLAAIVFVLLALVLLLFKLVATFNPVVAFISYLIVSIIVIAYFLLFVNMVMVFHYELVRHESVRLALKSMLDLSFRKGHHFMAHYAIVVVVMVVVNYLVKYFGVFLHAKGLQSGWWIAFNVVTGMIIFLLALAWIRFFVDGIVQRIKPHKKKKVTQKKKITKVRTKSVRMPARKKRKAKK
jgi:hypothetical protein